MSVYLIDYENIKSEGMNGIDELTKDDVVCLFYSENANTMTFRMHRKINDCRADFRFQDVGVGSKNALDFQLATYLGYVIAENDANEQTEQYYIVSKDKGYQSVCRFWSDRGYMVSMAADLTGTSAEDERESLLRSVESVIGDAETASKIVTIIQRYKTKQGINNALMRAFQSQDNKLSSEYYKAIKPFIKNKKGK